MIAGNPIADLLLTPLPPQWTVEQLAHELLAAIAARPSTREFVFGGEAVTERQAQRLLRPLLACLATKSAAATGTPINVYGGRLLFERRGSHGPVWIVGQFENTPQTARVSFRCCTSPPPEEDAALRAIAYNRCRHARNASDC